MITRTETHETTTGATVEVATVIHDGCSVAALGAVIDVKQGLIIGYASHGKPNLLRTWDGRSLGMLAITGQARGFNGAKLTCYSFEYQGRTYSGRGLGDGMSVTLRCKVSEALPRRGHAVTVADLRRLNTSHDTHHLYCRKCGASYSADKADYLGLWDETHVFKCCGVNNWLVPTR